jgi:hypothetical protein
MEFVGNAGMIYELSTLYATEGGQNLKINDQVQEH